MRKRLSPRLPPRMLEAFVLAGCGLSNKAIAHRMHLKPGAVKCYLSRAYRFFRFGTVNECSNRSLAVRWVALHGLEGKPENEGSSGKE